MPADAMDGVHRNDEVIYRAHYITANTIQCCCVMCHVAQLFSVAGGGNDDLAARLIFLPLI